MTILAVGSSTVQPASPFWGYVQHQPGTYPLGAKWSAVFEFLKTLYQTKLLSYNNPS